MSGAPESALAKIRTALAEFILPRHDWSPIVPICRRCGIHAAYDKPQTWCHVSRGTEKL